MSQPFDRRAICPAPRKPDERLKDWWVENPWLIAAKGKSQEFFEISGLTGGADSDGDGRAVVASDLNGDGMEDLIVRQAGGGPLLIFENQFPKAHWLEVSLRGTKSNSHGIGSRLIAQVGPQRLVRELYPQNGFKAQGPTHVHFGLGKAPKLDRLTINWPSGLVQEFKDIAIDRHIRIDEGNGQVATLQTSKR